MDKFQKLLTLEFLSLISQSHLQQYFKLLLYFLLGIILFLVFLCIMQLVQQKIQLITLLPLYQIVQEMVLYSLSHKYQNLVVIYNNLSSQTSLFHIFQKVHDKILCLE